ncbi:hypothetical protein CFHF_23770 [Caulobacter flavus]|uniref:Uncharacterized protein n=1 Tax=Caulobacter flavus TaxID=1679497 RepID=A0A2N5CM07_9CAUL|nr:hypothetical protein [Caulobacter flavus]AYV48142.1 hypothetical protein C1707_18780 [Caulobacter flavus]PLR06933.1 hypothetical protein CFHF_23770 [Caulobacter flavus]
MTAARSAREDGSVLIESLIAASLVAAILLAAFQVLSDSVHRREKVQDQRQAVAIARSRLAAVGSALPATPGRIEGVEAGYLWAVAVEACPDEQRSDAGLLRCVSVTVRRAAGAPPLARLTSRKLVRPDADAR